MPFDQKSLILREVWFPGGPRIAKNLIFEKEMEKIIQIAKTLKRLEMPKLVIRPLTRGL